jgi:hypothetical protein
VPKRDSVKQKKGAEKIAPCCLLLTPLTLESEKGFVLITALVILVLLTFLGIFALNTTTTEIQISGNDRAYKQAFYRADSGISYAVQSGIAIFPSAAPNFLTNFALPAGPLTADILLQYIDNGGSPRQVEVHSTGTAAGGGSSTLIAGIVGTMAGQQQGPNELGY